MTNTTGFNEINLLVRKANVSLFIGSGFSLKAGGPSATHLVYSLARRFPKGYKKGLLYLPLDDVSKEYVKYCHGDRKQLLEFLDNKMAFKRKDLSDHKALSQIPHFRNIFTTNYDTLLEDSYPQDIVRVVRCNGDCSSTEKAVNIFKIHGDLSCPDEIVITRDDYDALLSSEKNTLVWNRVIDAFTSTDILFIGYSLDDTNVQILLDKVSAALGEKRRRVFLIAPNLPEEKIYELTTRDVSYVNAYADEFLKSLTEDLKDNVYFDLVSDNVPQEIGIRFLENYKIKTVIEFDNGRLKVKSVNPTDETVPQTIHFTTKAQAGYFNDPSKFDFESLAPRSEQLKVPAITLEKDNIVSFERRINGVKVMDIKDIGSVQIGPSTIKEGQMDIIAPEVGFIEKVYYKTYKSANHLVLSIDTPLCELELIWTVEDNILNDCVIKAVYKEDYGQYEKAISWTNFLIALFSGKQVIFGGNISGHINPTQYKWLVSQFKRSLNYYENIHKIEILRKELFERHEKYIEGKDEVSASVMHMLAEDCIEEELNMEGRIEFAAIPGTTISACDGSGPIEFFAVRVLQTTDKDVVINNVNFGRITKWKDLTKSHIDKVYMKEGKVMATIAPDVDHWVVRYVKAAE